MQNYVSATTGIAQFSDSRDFDHDLVAGAKITWRFTHETNAGRSAGGNDVSGFEGKNARKECDQIGNLENQFAGVRILQRFAAHFDLDVELVRVWNGIGSHDPGTHRGERVKSFSHQPLRCRALVIAGGHVINDGVAEDMIRPAFRSDVAAAAANHESEFGLVIGSFRDLWKNDVRSGPDDGGWELVEDGRNFWNLCSGFGGVIAIIQTNTDQLARFWNGRKQFDVLQAMFSISGRLVGESFSLWPRIPTGLDELDERGEADRGQVEHCVDIRDDAWTRLTCYFERDEPHACHLRPRTIEGSDYVKSTLAWSPNLLASFVM